ncbi:MAG: hypothetical protein ACKO15_15905, partial [Burkholderiales bacterium]
NEGRNEGRNEPRSDRPSKGHGGGERNQPPRQNKADEAIIATVGAPEQSAAQSLRKPQPRPALEARPTEASEDSEGRSRRRRGRGGRGRGGREAGENRNTGASQEGVSATQSEFPVTTSSEPGFPTSTVSTAVAPTPVQQPLVASSSDVSAPYPVASATPVAAPATPTPAAPAPAPATTVYRSATAPIAPVDQIPDAAPVRSQPRQRRARDTVGQEPLVFIETDAGKAATNVQQATLAIIEPQRRSTPRPRRERVVVNEPLQVVETKTDVPPQA